MRKWLKFIFAVGFILLFLLIAFHFLQEKFLTAEFRVRAENKLSELLDTKVSVGDVQFGLWRHISLSGLQIDPAKTGLPIEVGVETIVIQYGLGNLLSRSFRAPSWVLLDSPAVDLTEFISPFKALHVLSQQQLVNHLPQIEFENGQVTIPLQSGKKKIELKRMNGKTTTSSDGLYEINLGAELGGMVLGQAQAEGKFKPSDRMSRLKVNLRHAALAPELGIPVTQVNGEFMVEENRIEIKSLSFKLRGLPFHLSGSISGWLQGALQFNLASYVDIDRKPLIVQIAGDLAEESISGEAVLLGAVYQFEGRLRKDDEGFHMDEVDFDNNYRGTGDFLIHEGRYRFRAERELQRFDFNLNLKNFNADLNLNVNHFKFFDHDLTTLAHMSFIPMDAAWQRGAYQFESMMETEYLVFDYHPLDDFHSSFTISQYGIDGLEAVWGGVSKLTGSIDFDDAVTVDGELLINQLDLTGLNSIGFHRMPESLEGTLDGKVRLIGQISRPEIQSRLTFSNGKIGNFKFDNGTIEARGVSPYLRLINSKVMRKGNTFLIRGDIDFELENIFQKVEIVSLDQIVLWKGIDITGELKTISDPRTLRFPAGDHVPTTSDSGPYAAAENKRFEMEYALDKKRSISVVAEDNGEKPLVTVGPKLRF
ncbi:MAG: hypothetical protein COV74_10050 [Candidatus Omnitrophica bacterium CG11_big_fil_rev_8_21_14_0_20_45_26]|uniref:AsmA-like C-terminal domain-containing protein n=1 Tax=Candidatus Abzuiibacterium crystallinum TaxID=1974748 RepID=A0A2H0LN79_9BACT|nr:MAG: hypothetical protein COV74_10050 [Candidatus Omnitrophica bacterium CG11_big_fil_rev_8_21_14_0_20_45_26]PIW63780.1 MAG: hypothetical protein COW12_08935 [Candidatus Omnitrophica bacterium CG12_big_fil_rev_8_21_14_0_65_45_16]